MGVGRRGSADGVLSAREGEGSLSVLAQETIERLMLSNGELAGLDARVVDTEQRVDVVHGLRTDVRELLDLGGGVLDLRKAYKQQLQ